MGFPLQTYWTWLVAAVIGAALLISECAVRPAHAEVYLDLAGGLTRFLITAPDGDYIQRDLPHTLNLNSLAYRIGLGYRFNERWSIQGGYVNLGTIKQDARFVADQDYNPKLSQCLANCATAPPYKMTDTYKGLELTATRTFPLGDWSLFLKGGGAFSKHTFSIVRLDTASFHENKGQFYSVVMGSGGCYQWACLELDYYHGLGGSNGFMGEPQGWPLSKELLVSWLSVKIPLFN